MPRVKTHPILYLRLGNALDGTARMSEKRIAHGFGSEFSREATNSYCLGKLPIFNIWQQIQIVSDPHGKLNKTYLEAMPDAHLQTPVLVMSDPRRFFF